MILQQRCEQIPGSMGRSRRVRHTRSWLKFGLEEPAGAGKWGRWEELFPAQASAPGRSACAEGLRESGWGGNPA